MDQSLLYDGALGGLVGLALGLLGGGGSVLAVPLLALGVGLDDKSALTASLLVVAASALAGGIPRVLAKTIDYRAAAIFGAVGALSSYLFSFASRPLPADIQVSLLAITMVISGTLMLRKARRAALALAATAAAPTLSKPGAELDSDEMLIPAVAEVGAMSGSLKRTLASALGAGALTGVTSIGGGFIIVPALILGAGVHVDVATGTSLLVITCNALAGFLGRGNREAAYDVRVLAFGAGAVLISLAGARVADRLASTTKTRIMGSILVVVGIGMLVRTILRIS